MAARQIIEVVKCRVADLKVGDIVRSNPTGLGWFRVEALEPREDGARIFVQKSRAIGPTCQPFALVDLQLTRTAYNNAPHMVDAHLPGEPLVIGAGATESFAIDDEEGCVSVTVHRSAIDGAVVVDIDTTFEPYGRGPGAPGDEGYDTRINLNDGKIWDCGLWNPKREERVPDSA